jgi:geranylgeranyl pyrophosphate synthase
MHQARQDADDFAKEAVAELSGLRDSDAKRALAELARFVVARNA